MNPFTHLKQTTLTLFVTIVLACFWVLPQLRAVTPTPDGCYPNYTTAEGCNALNSLTSGAGNTGLGWYSLFGDTTGSFNTAAGAGALVLNNGESNTANGTGALLLNTTGGQNTAVGASAMVYNDTGDINTAVGAFALSNNIYAGANTAVGASALRSHIGLPVANVPDVPASHNGAFGSAALYSDETGAFNNGFGDGALFANVSGVSNTAMGDAALVNSTGDWNTGLGALAGLNQDTGSNNIYIGDTGLAGESNVIAIGGLPGSGINYTDVYIGGIYDTVATERIVYISPSGHLGTLASSHRYKEEIKPMDKASEALFALKPVTFRYKQEIDPSHKLSFGLVAEDVAQVNAELVSRDKEGKPKTVRYEAVNAMLLNEFLKAHRRMEEQEATIGELKSALTALAATVKEQAAQIHKVSAQLAAASPSRGGLEASKSAKGRIRGVVPAPQVVKNP